MSGLLVSALVCGLIALGLNLVAILWMLRRRAPLAEAPTAPLADPLDDTVPPPLARSRDSLRVAARG